MKLKQHIYLLLDDVKGNKRGDYLVEHFISGLIILNVLAIVLESYHEINIKYSQFFNYFEYFSIVIFSLEYLIRIWIADLFHPEISPLKARIKYITSFIGFIDLISILPFYLPYLFNIDLRIVRSLRLFRLLRILKLNRHFKSLNLIGKILKKTKNEILVTLFIAFILLILASTLMYNIEHEAQPEAFENIGSALWWAVATLTTVGYGDIYPVTGLGKVLSGIIAILGIGIIALPTGIISSAYIEEIQNTNTICTCPNCGTEFKK